LPTNSRSFILAVGMDRMKLLNSGSTRVIRKLFQRANEEKDQSLFSLLSLIEQEIQMGRRYGAKSAMGRAKEPKLPDPRGSLIGLSRYVE
jgi:hypothetical protein